ncbi:hypothetical protein BOX30_09425 [Leptospirillum ferriphilum]|uniref:Uncharacterized protein n=1 Tax=Leptospirillum ferriphilum TaxID=178606 RepID=A0A1V3SU59_9BACT|nr:hypothetical protein BOX24_10650 [Leptospirillum ferriphilum]OOH77694.1 hypothetical protein BOX30_09425 [Leptospirillum ferriphilum]
MKFKKTFSKIEQFTISKTIFFFNSFFFNLSRREAFRIQNVGLTTIEKILGIERFADKDQSNDDTEKSNSQQNPYSLELLLNI